MPVIDTLKQTVSDFNSIKEAMGYIGFSVNNDPTSTYGNKIKSLKNELDSVDSLSAQVNSLQGQVSSLTTQNTNLNSTITEDNNNFSNIYDAIVSKGQTPVENDRSTYAQAILDIEGGSGSGGEITDAGYLFYEGARKEAIDTLLGMCANVTSWYRAFYYCPIPNGKRVVADLTHLSADNDNMRVFNETYPENNNAEITLVVKSNKFFRLAFSDVDSGRKLGLVNIEVHDISNGGFTTLQGVFYQSNNVKSILMDADCSNVTNMKEAFYQFNYDMITNAIHDLDLTSWGIDWTKINALSGAFRNSRFLTSIKLGNNAVIGNVDAYYAFANCISLKTLYMDIEDTQAVSNESYRNLFDNCNQLEEIVTTKEKWVIYNCTMRMFINCKKLTNIPHIELHICSTNMHNTTEYMYENCVATEIWISIIYEDTTQLWCQCTFLNCKQLEYVRGNFDMSRISNNSTGIFSGCTSLKCIETTGSFGGERSDTNLTLDLSASPVFEIENFLNNLDANESGKVHTIKLHSTVYGSLTDAVKELATSKGYTLSQ